jgi:hypothetical protein
MCHSKALSVTLQERIDELVKPNVRDERPETAGGAGHPAQAFGIIDPDYARIFTQARILAWQYGYACLAHGSFTRDLDLLLVPWKDWILKDPGGIVHRIADVCGLEVQGEPSVKPGGRRAWSLLLPGFSEVRWVDVSAFAPPEAWQADRAKGEQHATDDAT